MPSILSSNDNCFQFFTILFLQGSFFPHTHHQNIVFLLFVWFGFLHKILSLSVGTNTPVCQLIKLVVLCQMVIFVAVAFLLVRQKFLLVSELYALFIYLSLICLCVCLLLGQNQFLTSSASIYGNGNVIENDERR